MIDSFDIVIVGAGMVGLALANALRDSDKRIAIIGSNPIQQNLQAEPELRVSAINLHNQAMLEKLGVWSQLVPTRTAAYTDMLVWEQNSAAKIIFSAAEVHSTHLGTIVENQALVNALAQNLQGHSNISVFAPIKISSINTAKQHVIVLEDNRMLTADVVVGADGANSLVRASANLPVSYSDYGQTAIVATIATELPHNGCARQVFTTDGPLALLPLADPHLVSIVWSQTTSVSKHLLQVSDKAFNQRLNVVSNNSLGLLALNSERQSFPLTMRYARQWLKDNRVLCGDAAHTIHPLAGQGVNLGFGDAWHLAEALLQQGSLREYERARKTAAIKMIAAMEGFHRLFTGDHPLKKATRGLGLSLANVATPIKRPLLRTALGI